MAQQEDIVIDQGSDFIMSVFLGEKTGVPKNLTGYNVSAKLKKTHTANNSTAIPFTCSIVDPPETGEIILSLTNEQTETLKIGQYVYDIEIDWVSNNRIFIERVLEGIVFVSGSVTK